jgi:Zn-finger protein
VNYRYFTHAACLFFPCHELEDWASCLFCWCPLYMLDCGGNFADKEGIKDCSGCVIPHTKEGYDYILDVVQRDIFGRQQVLQHLSHRRSQGERKMLLCDKDIERRTGTSDDDVF